MNKFYVKFYTNFKRPPFAPTFYPSEEEFADPIGYIAKIKPEAEPYGIVKVKPPMTFRPPFGIDGSKFTFTPRIQKLNQIEALSRAKTMFEAQLACYWHFQGITLEIAIIDNKPVDYYNLYQIVAKAGGAATVSAQRRWVQVTKKLGYKQLRAPRIKNLYFKWLDGFQRGTKEIQEILEKFGTSQMNGIGSANGAGNGFHHAQPRTKSMAGLRHHIKERKMKLGEAMDQVVCKICGKGNDEANLLLCEDCDEAQHIYCCTPPLKEVPKYEWRCRRCVLMAVNEIAESYAFHDAHTSYTLPSFAEYANEWKKNYFQRNPQDVPCEEVEREFWKNIVDLENTVAVKYGADLPVSKVGSGFPMKNERFGGAMDSSENAYYANHPWNLNNLPILKDSVLSYMDTGISGMMVPWVYVGMCFSAFCWHTEDHWTYSVNYMHWGERKIWYGVSGNEGQKFDEVMMDLVPYLFERQPEVLHHMTTAMNPEILISKGIHVYTVHQEPGEFVITFPRSYHAGYNEGLNFAEAVNFAPVDWLRKGRLCILDYARVHRTCVFSHEELMFKMAQTPKRLGINVAVAVHDEMLAIIDREQKLRGKIELVVPNSTRMIYEGIPDDFRACAVCKTTMYLSAVECHHRLVCLDHVDRICETCPQTDLIFNYRYTIREMSAIVDKLLEVTSEFVNWRSNLTLMLHSSSGHKPRLAVLRSMIKISKLRRFPPCEVGQEAITIIKQCYNINVKARALLSHRVRTRKNSRNDVAEYPATVGDIKKLKTSIDELPCTMPGLQFLIKNFIERCTHWQKRCAELTNGAVDVTEKYDSYIDTLNKMINEADEFNVELSELDELHKFLAKCQWLQRAKKLLNSAEKKHPADELLEVNHNIVEDPFRIKGAWELQGVSSLITEGTPFAENDDKTQKIIDSLKIVLKMAQENESAAKSLLSDTNNAGMGLDEAKKFMMVLKNFDWLTAENVDKFRIEYQQAMILLETTERFRENANYTLKSLEGLLSRIEKSLILKDSSVHTDMKRLRDCLEGFCRRVSQMFVPSPSYHGIIEILNGRDDLTSLAEGALMPLHPHQHLSLRDDWAQIGNFFSTEQLENHINSLYGQQRRMMVALRNINENRPVDETCSCVGDIGIKIEDDFIRCLLCHAKFHSTCVEWNWFMAQLPVGYYLCVRCLRSRRPLIEDVKGACATVVRSLETILVNTVLKRTECAYQEALDVINSLPASGKPLTPGQCKNVDECLIPVFCNEIMNSDAWKVIMGVLVRVKPPTEKDKEIYERLKQRPVSAGIPGVLFCQSNGDKSFGNLKRNSFDDIVDANIASHPKRAKREFHSEQEACSAVICLKPNSDHIRWIQCEAGCSRWYHYVCVGQTVRLADTTTSYCCFRCMPVNKPSASSSDLVNGQ